MRISKRTSKSADATALYNRQGLVSRYSIILALAACTLSSGCIITTHPACNSTPIPAGEFDEYHLYDGDDNVGAGGEFVGPDFSNADYSADGACNEDGSPMRLGPLAFLRSKLQAFHASKEEERNQPPHPRFHPVPTRPVFQPAYGRDQVVYETN